MIIGICGHKGVGKSTVSEVAINLKRPKTTPFIRIGFSDPLYSMLLAMGIPEEIVFNKTRWNEPLDILCGQTTRFACDTLGNGWGRDTIGKNVWVNAGINRAKELNSKYHVIIDNVRYFNEAEAVIENGGFIIAFHRKGVETDLTKPSEKEIPAIQRTLCKWAFASEGENLEWNAKRFRKLIDNAIANTLLNLQ